MSRDRAGRAYWDELWRTGTVLSPENSAGIRNYVNRRLERYFHKVLSEARVKPGVRLLEVGCARSQWLPYFARTFDCAVSGLDYSPAGCASAAAVLANANVKGDIRCGDLFANHPDWFGTFDVVFSNGLVEHFDDTAACLRAIRRFLRPEGLIITSIPNMVGMIGRLQKRVNRSVFDVHVPLSAQALRVAHDDAGFERCESQYFMFANSGVINPGPEAPRWKRDFLRGLGVLSMGVWLLDGEVGRLPPNRISSPYVICTAFNCKYSESHS
jgi:2-polyprenyl-3-methyl-5-hydroxy-6-metoxy-1,4-benzoquinol methylase